MRMDEINIRPGTIINLELINSAKKRRFDVPYIGCLPSKAVFISTPVINGLPVNVVVGGKCAIRFMSGKDIFGFKSDVRMVHSKPFNHIILSYPENIEIVSVRQAERVRAFVEARTQIIGGDGKQIISMIRNISVTGALLVCEQSLGEIDKELKIEFKLPFADTESNVSVKASIKNISDMPPEEGEDHALRRYGVMFNKLDDSTRILLHGYIYEQQTKNRLFDVGRD